MAVGEAVAALAAAGNDAEALEQAIKAAAHLDEKPGDDRQKLRGVLMCHIQFVTVNELIQSIARE